MIRAARPDDLGAVAALLGAVRGDDLHTARGVRHEVETEPAHADGARWVAEERGIVGYAVAFRRWWREPNDAYAWAGVSREARGRGIGRARSGPGPRSTSLYELAIETSNDIPGSEGSHTLSFDDWQNSLLRYPDLHPGASSVVMHEGRPVALALLSVDLATRRARNEDTGTARAHRRRGLATLAKLASIRCAREHGIESILTDNAEQNAGMLAINERLGYRPLMARRRWIKAMNA